MSIFKNSLFRPISAALLLVVFFVAWKALPVQEWSDSLGQFAESQGPFGVVIYVLIFIMATVALFPCAVLTFAAGMTYGLWALPFILVATGIGASISFFVARRWAQDEVDQWMQKREWSRALKTALENQNWKFMLLFRVSPLVPFNLNSYFLGTVKMRFPTFIAITLLGALPGTLLFLYLGSIGRTLDDSSELKIAMAILGVLAAGLVARITLKKTRDHLRKTMDVPLPPSKSC